jgi:acyl-CoA thioesterase FadM
MIEPYRKQYTIHAYEVDASGRAQLPSLLNYLQDAAGDHAGSLGLGVTDLLRNRLTWLLSRYHIKVVRYPVHGQRIEVSTWPSGKKGIFALRDFEVSDEEGNPMLAATTSWVLIDLESKQPVRLNNFVPDDLTFNKRAIEDEFPPLPELARAPAPRPGRGLGFQPPRQQWRLHQMGPGSRPAGNLELSPSPGDRSVVSGRSILRRSNRFKNSGSRRSIAAHVSPSDFPVLRRD